MFPSSAPSCPLTRIAPRRLPHSSALASRCPSPTFRQDGPISGVSVGLIDGEFIINPTAEQKRSQMAVTVASTDERIAMIEAGANEVSDEDMFNGIMAGHAENQKIIEFIKGIQRRSAKRSSLTRPISRIRRCSKKSAISPLMT